MIINPKYKSVFFSPLAPGSVPVVPIEEEEETTTNSKPKKKNLITALKKLYQAFGGKDEVKNNAVDIVDKIADQVEDGGGGSSSEEPLIITFSGSYRYDTTGTPNDSTCDKTWSEILEAYNNNRPIKCYYMLQQYGNLYHKIELIPNFGITIKKNNREKLCEFSASTTIHQASWQCAINCTMTELSITNYVNNTIYTD